MNNFKLMALTTEYISSDFAPSVSDNADMATDWQQKIL